MKPEAFTLRRPAPTSHQLARRQQQLQDLQRYLSAQEQEFGVLRKLVLGFAQRYDEQLGALYEELEGLDAELLQTMQRIGDAASLPVPRRSRSTRSALPRALPAAAAMPAEPSPEQASTPPSLKQLYRRAAMRVHPDHAADESSRRRSEHSMAVANAAYAAGDRAALERLLIQSGESAARVKGCPLQARQDWIEACERIVQARLALLQCELQALRAAPMHQLWQAITLAEQQGLDPLALMAKRLRSQIRERRQELYIGQRLRPDSTLARDFLRQCTERAPLG